MTEEILNTEEQSTERFYIPQLDGLRALAFFLVFLHHLSPLPISTAWHPVGVTFLNACNKLMSWGWVGVEIFFVLSAFLITSLLLKEREKYGKISFKLFFTRRALRIWPLYYFMILLGFFLLPAMHYGLSWGSSDWQVMLSTYLAPYMLFLANFCFLNTPFAPIQAFLPVAWSVAMEEQFYFAWGLSLSRIKDLKTIHWIVGCGLVFTILLRWYIHNQANTHHAFYGNTFSHLDPILCGIALAVTAPWFQNKFSGHKWLAALVLIPLASYLFIALFAPDIYANHPSIILILTLVAFNAALLLLGCMLWEPAERFFATPSIRKIGQLTYGMYFFHILAQTIAKPFVLVGFGSAIGGNILLAWLCYAVLGLLLTWLMARLSWSLLEKRFYAMRYRFTRIPSGFNPDSPEAPAKNKSA